MNDHGPSSREGKPRRGREPTRFVSLVEQLHRQAQQRRPQADNQAPHEAPLVGVTRRLVWATWLLVLVGFLSLGAAILQWLVLRKTDKNAAHQVEVMRGQLEEMQVEQRAWLYADTFIGGRIGDGEENYYIPVTLYYHNTGHLPALFIVSKLTARVVVEGGLLSEKNEVCDEYRERPLKDTDRGQTTFPSQEHTGSTTNVDFKKADWTIAKNGIGVLVVGCVDYRYPGSKVHHQTRFGLVVGAASAGGTISKLPRDPTSVDIGINGTYQGIMASAD